MCFARALCARWFDGYRARRSSSAATAPAASPARLRAVARSNRSFCAAARLEAGATAARLSEDGAATSSCAGSRALAAGARVGSAPAVAGLEPVAAHPLGQPSFGCTNVSAPCARTETTPSRTFTRVVVPPLHAGSGSTRDTSCLCRPEIRSRSVWRLLRDLRERCVHAWRMRMRAGTGALRAALRRYVERRRPTAVHAGEAVLHRRCVVGEHASDHLVTDAVGVMLPLIFAHFVELHVSFGTISARRVSAARGAPTAARSDGRAEIRGG